MLNFLFILVLRNSDLPMNHRKAMVSSPEKEDRYYTTRGSLGLDENGKVLMDHVKEDRGHVWPKLFITLSSKEKEDDFLAMKGCKLPQRPKKRAKLIQKSLLVSIFHTHEELSVFMLKIGRMQCCGLDVLMPFFSTSIPCPVGQSRCMVIGSVPREI